MKKFEAPTLEEAYAEAAKAFSCSITELDIQIVQNPSKGFLGFGRKSAIIVAACSKEVQEKSDILESSAELSKVEAEENREEVGALSKVEEPSESVMEETIQPAESQIASSGESKPEERSLQKEDEIFDNFYTESPDIHTVAVEVEHEINGLFASACFDIEPIRVSAYDEETLLIEFNGADAALLIGKEGYRYKALAYLLYNWIHGKYGYKLRLEIAEFLKNQEVMIENYLQPIVERVENEGRGQTKVLDGILVQIALKRLREFFPDKYVAVRTNREGGRYIIINEFMERR
ncbi:Jag N-terminal domain-containing protein [Hydrogenimonas cancrithermarum]|uniref:RNA-binding protein KhpB N-terminal domain-containing protein n=1 Tax=Hydrogenimonas cancrithermarum TaxID=2993563 RepID=A0ABM8FKZ4_9BACT|nr:Jag N-terminal domain-containing protein [Hydrogenimonas cancrithermarum]BDY12054.1 hypothetical protein HCR_03660 [Hydrogenimonas cancrithermarum]